MAKFKPLKGTGVALITPFKDGQVDFAALARVIDHVINGGVSYVVSMGTTGEPATMSLSERQAVLNFTVTHVNNRVPIVAGCFGGSDTQAIINNFSNYDLSGVVALLSASPSYTRPTQEGLYGHYAQLAEAAPHPLIIYNVPSRTAMNVEPETILRLAEDYPHQIVAVKEAAGDLVQANQLIKHCPDDFLVLSGDDQITLGMLASGGDGVISVIANAYPYEFSQMVASALDNDFGTASYYHNLLWDLHHYVYIEGNPTGIKATMQLLGLAANETRSPLTTMTENQYKLLAKAMAVVKSKQQVV